MPAWPHPRQSPALPASWRMAGPALLLAAALGLLYAPMLAWLARYYWPEPTHSHGPLVLLACVALFVMAARRPRTQQRSAPPPRQAASALIGLGLLLHALGSIGQTVQLSALSLAPLLAGLSLRIGGLPLLRAQAFAYFFLLFLMPWPAWITDPLMQPLKLAISHLVEALLHALDYPVARRGVVLEIGGYRLLVADACAGMNSLFMLEAFGLLYLHLLRHPSALRNLLLGLLIVPVSFIANTLRVLVLALLTFHGGDALGQGFMHDFSGLLLFAAALLLLAPLDAGLRRLGTRPAPGPRP